MNNLSNLLSPTLVLILVMLAPYLVAAVLSAAFPGWRRRIGDYPSTGQMVVRFFDGADLDRSSPGTETRRV